ncbi:hypothetical protein DRO97_10035 [Archaeoglobales archaeon]|nr:MAG: hypothetical protein DRO97_10035 [Archaeoglobales archaeon]
MYYPDLEIKKAGRIAEVGLKLTTLLNLYNILKPKIFGEFLKETLEDLGCVFVKFGQLLTYQPLNEEIKAELNKLMYQVKQFDTKKAEKIVESRFGERIRLRRIATASIAQVHRDWCGNAVKVRKPGIVDEVKRDLDILNSLPIPISFFTSTIKLLNKCLKDEVDFSNEAKNMQEFSEFSGLKIPEVYNFCEDVLIMEFAEGVNVLEIEKLSFDARKRAFWLLLNCIVDCIENGKIHGDPSFSNVFVNKDGDVTLIDFGIVWRANKKQKEVIRDLYNSLILKDFDSVIYIVNDEILKTEIDLKIDEKDLGRLLFSDKNIIDVLLEEGIRKNADVKENYLIFLKSIIQWLKLSRRVMGGEPKEEDIIKAIF